MKSADLITSFFNNELSPEQERQFLLTVASSDSMRLGLKSHVMLDRILQEENQEMAVAPTTRRTILREAAAVAALAGGATQYAQATESSEPSAPLSSGIGFPSWGAATLSLLVAIGSFYAGFTLNVTPNDGAITGFSAAQETDATRTLVEQESGLRSVLEWIDFEDFNAVPVQTIAGELAAVVETIDVTLTEDLESAPAPVRQPAAIRQGDQASVRTDRNQDEPAAVDSSNDQGDPVGPNTIDGGSTIIKKPNRNN